MGVSIPKAALALSLSIGLLGCSGGSTSSPTDPTGAPVMEFVGTLTFQGTNAHDVVLAEDSLLSVTLADLELILFDTTQVSPDNVQLGLGVGQREADDSCNLTANFVITERQLTIIRLSLGSYCLTVFDPGLLPEDAVVGYRLAVELNS